MRNFGLKIFLQILYELIESNEIWISVLYNNGKFVNVHVDSKWSNFKWIGTEFKPEDSKINLETLFHEFELEKLG